VRHLRYTSILLNRSEKALSSKIRLDDTRRPYRDRMDYATEAARLIKGENPTLPAEGTSFSWNPGLQSDLLVRNAQHPPTGV
jgi:hypothetical protein